MTFDIHNMPKVLEVYLKLSEYPILAREIRERMRQEMFARGTITQELFDQEVENKAVRTQQHEGLSDPFAQESAAAWSERIQIVRDHLTDFYFALNHPQERFEEIVRSVISPRQPEQEVILTFNPELAPWDLLFAQAEEYEKLPPEKKQRVRHHLQQIIVVLVRGMISDQLEFVGIAREYLDIFDLRQIFSHRIGRGKIGGKAAGMILAHKVLQAFEPAQADLACPIQEYIDIPDSYFIGADVFYDFLAHNELYSFFDQKYKPLAEIEADYPQIYQKFTQARFPQEIIGRLTALIKKLGKTPLIVRSSSLLEDNFGKSFAGKYDSFFCPNQGSLEENLDELVDAIRRVYASTLNPSALFYRQQMGLVDYDERMAILIQRVQGTEYGRYFFPAVAGVGFGRNPFRWNRKIRREDGFLRIVWGLGTRAVDRVANDYPRMVALSHPQLRPEATAADIKKYAQHFVDVIDVEENAFKTLPVKQIISSDYPSIELIASEDKGDYVKPIYFRHADVPPNKLVLTFERLLKEKTFTDLIKTILNRLEAAYGRPVDIEFTVEIIPDHPTPRFKIHLLQCRPLSSRESEQTYQIPAYLPAQDMIFTSTKLIPDGIVPRIEYVVYVDAHAYAQAPDYATRHEIARAIGRLNQKLADRRFILVGPGRWGTSNTDLGVKVRYADIYNTSMLIEVAFAGADGTPEPSYGTHFFQDLVEANIHPLSLYPDQEGTVFKQAFFLDTPNALADWLPQDQALAPYLKLIDVPAVTGGRLLEVVMNAEEEKAVGFIRGYEGE